MWIVLTSSWRRGSADGAAAVFFPLHVVLSDCGLDTQVHILALLTLPATGVTPAIRIPVHRTPVPGHTGVEGNVWVIGYPGLG